MKLLNIYYAAALKAEVDARPYGFKTKLGLKAGVSPSQVSDIIRRNRYGSEETRRALVDALGWDYEDFLRYGKSLVEGRPYEPALPAEPTAFDQSVYLAVPYYNKIISAAAPGGEACRPDLSGEHPPVLIYRPHLKAGLEANKLAAFTMPDAGMSPTIAEGSLLLVDLTENQPEDNKLYLIGQPDRPGNYLVRRLRVKTGGNQNPKLYLLSDNPAYYPDLLEEPWSRRIVGRVVASWSEHD